MAEVDCNLVAEEEHCSVKAEGHSPLCACHFYSAVGSRQFQLCSWGPDVPRDFHSPLPPSTINNPALIRPFSYLLFHDQSYLKTKFRIVRYFSDSPNLEQCLAHNGPSVKRMQQSNFNNICLLQKSFLKTNTFQENLRTYFNEG